MKTISFAAQLAMDAYSDMPSVAGCLIRQFNSENIQGFTAQKGDDLWIVFCGTNETEDWMNNLNAGKEAMPFGGSVHAGFNHALDDVWDNILFILNHGRWNQAHFVGHSLGGALAALAASRLVYSNFSRRKFLWTFGQPRCGDEQWAEMMELYLAGRYIRVFNAGDLVPHLPTAWRFRHAGREMFFDNDGRKRTPSKWHRMSEACKALVTNRKASLVTLHAHSMNTYLTNVLNSMEEF
ncbi:MAG: lipase family protein [Magnetococcus sp. YQC-5]